MIDPSQDNRGLRVWSYTRMPHAVKTRQCGILASKQVETLTIAPNLREEEIETCARSPEVARNRHINYPPRNLSPFVTMMGEWSR